MAEVTDPIPGFDPQQSVTLRAVMKETAETTLKVANDSRACPRDCESLERVDAKAEKVHRWVFGRSEEKMRGADDRLDDVEEFVSGFKRLKWLIIAAVVAGTSSTVVGLIMLVANLAAKG